MHWRRLTLFLAPVLALALPVVASAHEVYVLSPSEITYALGIPPFNMIAVVVQNLHEFIFWTFIAFVLISTVFCVSIFRYFEVKFDPFFDRTKKYAPLICRITVGLGLLAGAYYQASYGPELSFSASYGLLTPFITALTVILGLCILCGLWTRLAALGALALFAAQIYFHGIYMLTYTNYFGEFALLALFGTSHAPAEKKARTSLMRAWQSIESFLAPYSFVFLRVSFGISLLYASVYAKILHNNLALLVAELPLAGHQYGVAHYLGFEPHFLVLGAAIVELLIASFFIFGIEIRWTCIFLEFWLMLSLFYFGEVVWPHLILIGIPIALFLYGYDRYSIEGFVFKDPKRQPVL